MVIEPFIEDLTNWYVRRSRRRFWKSEQDVDKNTAYSTLYHVLVKLAKLLAPFTPYVTEVMYQNLVRSTGYEVFESIHHTDWPVADVSVVNDKLIDQMALAQHIASLGLSARSGAGIKVRQPLAKVLVYVNVGHAELGDDLIAIVSDELNVKAFEFVEEAGELVEYRILPNNKLLGPKYGAQFPKIRAALAGLEPAGVVSKVEAGEIINMAVEGDNYDLIPEEILIETQPAKGLTIAADKMVTVAVDSVITPELRTEGLAREIIRRVQAQRKNADFNIEDRITTYYIAEGDLAEVFTAWGDYIKAETLTTELVAGEPSHEAYTETHKVDGMDLTIAVQRNAN
jgi:isoleucyl-tRNA synthetase